MSQVLTPTLQRLSGFRLRKIRELSLPGVVTVKAGDRVKADDIIAKAEFPGDLIIMKLPEQMGVEARDISQALLVKENDELKVGQKICEFRGLFGLFKNTCNSSYEGKVEFVNQQTGHIGVRLASRTVALQAYIPGQVVEVEDKKSATIETVCTFVQGIFGVGSEKHGILKSLKVKHDSIISEADIPEDCSGLILFGGAAPDIAALKKASQAGAVGFITASIDDKALAEYLGYDIGIALTGNEPLSMTLILTEGFGKLTFSDTAYSLLKRCEGRQASINGATQVRAGALRPEIIIPTDDKENTQSIQQASIEVGRQIRIIREPYFGMHAKVRELPFKPEVIETGAEVRVLKAELGDGTIVTVPRANVEIL